VYAAWVAVEKKEKLLEPHTVYIDPATIRREGNLVTLWQLNDFKWKQGDTRMGGRRFFSTKTHKQFDCAAKRVRLLAFTEFSRRMGIGSARDRYVDQDTWLPVEPESLNHSLRKVACKHAVILPDGINVNHTLVKEGWC
jgi:hypothetical protein